MVGVDSMDMNEKIDRLRRANVMRVDKKYETVAVQHYCSIHYHRCLVLEGARRVALHSTANWEKTDPGSIIDDGTANLIARKYSTPVEVIVEELNSIFCNMFGIFITSLWEVYLCLLHEELRAYRRLISKNSAFEHPPLSDFLDRNGDLLTYLRKFRDILLHPESRTSIDEVIDGLLSEATRQHRQHQGLIIEAQFLIDAHTVKFWYSMGSYFITEGDKEIGKGSLDRGYNSRIDKLNRIAEGICHRPIPKWPDASDVIGRPSKIQLLTLIPMLNARSSSVRVCRKYGELYPAKVIRAKRGCIQMIMRALAFYNEVNAFIDIENLAACPVDPSTDSSIDVQQFFRAENGPQTLQELENRTALMRIAPALLYEPLRLYWEVSKKVQGLRVPELDAFVGSKSNLDALRTLRKGVFHVPFDQVDLDSRSAQFMPLSMTVLELLEPLIYFYYHCPDSR